MSLPSPSAHKKLILHFRPVRSTHQHFSSLLSPPTPTTIFIAGHHSASNSIMSATNATPSKDLSAADSTFLAQCLQHGTSSMVVSSKLFFPSPYNSVPLYLSLSPFQPSTIKFPLPAVPHLSLKLGYLRTSRPTVSHLLFPHPYPHHPLPFAFDLSSPSLPLSLTLTVAYPSPTDPQPQPRKTHLARTTNHKPSGTRPSNSPSPKHQTPQRDLSNQQPSEEIRTQHHLYQLQHSATVPCEGEDSDSDSTCFCCCYLCGDSSNRAGRRGKASREAKGERC